MTATCWAPTSPRAAPPPAEPDRDPGGRRRRRLPARRGDRDRRAARASTSPGWRPSGSPRSSASTSPWPSCTSPTPPWPPWPRSSGSTARRRVPARGEAERLADGDRPGRGGARRRPRRPRRARGAAGPGRGGPDDEPDTTAREQLAEAAREARQGEMDARLALRTSEERARALHGRADQLARAAQAERESRARAAERRERLLREGRAAEAVGVAVGVVLQRLEVSIHRAAEARVGRRGGSRGARAAAADRARCAPRPRPRARRAGELGPPRRDGARPAADADRAARGAGARGARARRRRAGRRLRPRPAGALRR